MVTRAEHRRQTLLGLGEAAVDLFETVGPSATVEAIAERAGVSRRTVFRWVDAKEQLAFVHPMLWFDVFDAALAEIDAQPDGERPPLTERLRLGSRAIAQHIDAEPDSPRRAFATVAAHPELARGFSGVFQQWVDRVALEVLAAGDPADPTDRFRARVIGSAVMGMVDAVTREWVFSPDASFVDLYDEGFALLAPVMSVR